VQADLYEPRIVDNDHGLGDIHFLGMDDDLIGLSLRDCRDNGIALSL